LRKKLCFSAATVALVFATLELGLWLLRVPALRDKAADPYAGFTSTVPHFRTFEGAGGEELVGVAPNKLGVLNDQTFPARKPTGSFRIVCLGGSTTYGRPFFDLTSYPGWLRAYLPLADPTRKWEVINAGAISYASYRVKGVMNELARFEPDLFIIDVGHNEFLERRTYDKLLGTHAAIRDAAGWVSATRVAGFMARMLEAAGLIRATLPQGGGSAVGDEVKHVSLSAVGPEAYTRDPEFRREVLAHFRATLREMAEIARRANARVVFVVPASNLLDFAPFKSELSQALTPQAKRAWLDAFERGQRLAASGQITEALEAFQQVQAIDDRHAGLLFQVGRIYWQLGKYDEALTYLSRARDEDICPLRALSETSAIIREVAAEVDAPVLDFDEQVRTSASHGIPSAREFCDHVHHQVVTNQELAIGLVEKLATLGIAALGSDWTPVERERVNNETLARIDRKLYAAELKMLARLLSRLSQKPQALERLNEALAYDSDSVETLELAGELQLSLGMNEEAFNSYHQITELASENALAQEGMGVALIRLGRFDDALKPLQNAIALMPNRASAFANRGIASAELGKLEDAVTYLRKAVQLAPGEAWIHSNLGLAEEKRGSRRDAALHYQNALAIDPSDRVAAAGRSRLSVR
jgi:tetratricopeptide (TPR) repeat protein